MLVADGTRPFDYMTPEPSEKIRPGRFTPPASCSPATDRGLSEYKRRLCRNAERKSRAPRERVYHTEAKPPDSCSYFSALTYQRTPFCLAAHNQVVGLPVSIQGCFTNGYAY